MPKLGVTMKPAKFNYVVAKTLAEAIELLCEGDGENRILSGGQSLIPAMNLRLARPDRLIDIANLLELRGIREDEEFLRIGALMTHDEIGASQIAKNLIPVLAEAISHIGHAAIRNRGTIGGSLANADPAAEWPCVLLALSAQITATGPSGERVIPAEEFFVTYYTTALSHDEIVTEICIPKKMASLQWSFQEVSRQQGAFAIALTMAGTTTASDGSIAEMRLAVGGCGSRPVLAIESTTDLPAGTMPNTDLIEEMAERALQKLEPSDDAIASAEDRLNIARVLITRTLSEVFQLYVERGQA